MRPSPWDLIAPAYWTKEQSDALSATLEERKLTCGTLKAREQKRIRRQTIRWLLQIAVFLCILLVSWSDLGAAYAYWLARLPWLPTWPMRLGGLPTAFQILMLFCGVMLLFAAAFVVVAHSDAVAPHHRQARALRVYLARLAVRGASREFDRLLVSDLQARRELWSSKLAQNVKNAAFVDCTAPVIGPERCPECGSLWPLLPPPLSPTGCMLPPRCPETAAKPQPLIELPVPQPDPFHVV